ncbi:hypothetical protein CsatB_011145 [Cannabis sativa]
MSTTATGEHETLFEQLKSTDESVTPDKFSDERNNKRSIKRLEKQIKKMKRKNQTKEQEFVKLLEVIVRLVEVVEFGSRSNEISNVDSETSNSSIPDVIKVLNSLPGIEIGSNLYFFATRLFIVKEKREIFLSLENPNLKLDWLKYEQKMFISSN